MAKAGEDDEVEVSTGTESEVTAGQDGDEEGADDAADTPEHADDEEDSGEQEVEAAAAGDRPTRGQNRFQALANERKAEKERADRLEREISELRRGQQQGAQRTAQEDEANRLALMTPAERAEYKVERLSHQLAQTQRQTQIQMAMATDKATYDAQAAVNPVYARHAAEVERRFAEQVARGAPVERKLILQHILGEKALAGAGSGATRRQAQAGARKVAAQRVPPGSARGDQPSQRSKQGDTAENRLKDVII